MYKIIFLLNRFCGKKPVLLTMYSEDIQQRGRFIWTNITILQKNVEAFQKYNIFLKKIDHDSEDEGKISTIKLLHYRTILIIFNLYLFSILI